MEIKLRLIDQLRWCGEPIRGQRLHVLVTALVTAGRGGASSAALIDAIWGENSPANPHKALQILISRLRAATTAHIVQRTATGYRFGLEPGEVDLLAREDLVKSAQAALDSGDFPRALTQAHAAADFEPHLRARRVAALAAAHLGRHEHAAGELAELLDHDPHDEDVAAAFLRSLAATRGPAAALERFEQLRRDLADGLGTDPGPQLRAVHRELLGADQPIRSGVQYAATSLVGRSGDMDRIEGLLTSARLVSILGTGGLGKTRLAQELAARSPRPAVHVVELIGVSAPEDVPGAIAAALNLRDSVAERDQHIRSSDLPARLAAQLQGTPSLLVLDNCEHVVDAVADVVAFLLAQVGDLQILTTSRTPLRLTAEHVYSLDQLGTEDAVALFEHRARAARPDALLDPEAIEALVTRLDGLPLAIELAAAQVRIMSVREIVANLRDRFVLLRSADRSAPDRHQTLLAVIDWSWRLLDRADQHGLMYLSLLPDGITGESAHHLLGPGGVAALATLADHSLLTTAEAGAQLRYHMLETVREYAWLHLAETGTQDRAEQAFLSWARELCRSVPEQIFTHRQLSVIAAIGREQVNLIEALRWAENRGDTDSAITILGAVVPYWLIRGDHFRIFDQFTQVEQMVHGWQPPPALAAASGSALSIISMVWSMLPQETPPTQISRVLDEVEPAIHDPLTRALCHLARVMSATRSSHQNQQFALAHLQELTNHSDRHVAMCAALFLAGAQENNGHTHTAISTMTAALELTREDDAPWLPTNHQMTLAQLHAQTGDLAAAAAYAQRALPMLERFGADGDALQCRMILAHAELARGDVDAARVGLEAVAEHQRQGRGMGSRLAITLSQAELAFAQGQTDHGLELLDEARAQGARSSIAGRFDDHGLGPWTLLAYGFVLAARAWHDPSTDTCLWQDQVDRARRAADPSREWIDYPVLGTLLFGLGIWGLRHGRLSTGEAAALLVLAEAFSYNQFLPSLQWQAAADELARHDPAALERSRADLGHVTGPALLQATVQRLALIAPVDSSSPTGGRRSR